MSSTGQHHILALRKNACKTKWLLATKLYASSKVGDLNFTLDQFTNLQRHCLAAIACSAQLLRGSISIIKMLLLNYTKPQKKEALDDDKLCELGGRLIFSTRNASVAFFSAVSTAPKSSVLAMFNEAKVSKAFAWGGNP